MHRDFAELRHELAAAIVDLSSDQTQFRPSSHPEKWSIQQIVDHLHRTFASTLAVFATRIERGEPTKAKPTLQQRIGQFLLITLGHFPSGKISPAAVAPPAATEKLAGAELAHLIGDDVERLDRSAEAAEVLLGKRRSVSHMVLGPLSVAQWRRFHLIHVRHHIEQIATIRKDHGMVR